MGLDMGYSELGRCLDWMGWVASVFHCEEVCCLPWIGIHISNSLFIVDCLTVVVSLSLQALP